MLVLTRRVGESVHINEDIVVTVLSIRENENQVKIGVDAPKDIRILRGELIGRGKGGTERQSADR